LTDAPRRGDLIWINFNPQSGHEQAGRRPGIVLSPKTFNETTGFAVICPITNQQKGYPFEVEIPGGLSISGVILADQVKSLDWRSRKIDVADQAGEETVGQCTKLISKILQIKD
jgi:mRNA interferase MazF